MSLKDGYSYATVAENINLLCREGKSRPQASAIAYAHARVSYFNRHPDGALPEWIAYPHNKRLRQHYDGFGKSLIGVKGRAAFLDNPRIASSKHQLLNDYTKRDIAAAKKLYRDFTGHDSASMRQVRIPSLPKAGLVFGQLVQVGYRSARDGQLYRHTFSAKSRPLLIASSDGKQVLIFGGGFTFTDRGIEDVSPQRKESP